MRARILLIGAVALTVAACSTAATRAPSPATSPSPAPVASPSPSQAAAPPSIEPVAVKVTFDGKTCTYLGPTSVPDGTPMRFEFSTSVDAGLVVGGATASIPQDITGKIFQHASTPGSWFDSGHVNSLIGNGTVELTATSDGKKIVTNELISRPDASDVGVFVGCTTPPDKDDLLYAAALIRTVAD